MEKQGNNQRIVRLPVTALPKEVAAVIIRDGGVIIEGFLTKDEVAMIEEETEPHWAKQGKYVGDLHGANDAPLRCVFPKVTIEASCHH